MSPVGKKKDPVILKFNREVIDEITVKIKEVYERLSQDDFRRYVEETTGHTEEEYMDYARCAVINNIFGCAIKEQIKKRVEREANRIKAFVN